MRTTLINPTVWLLASVLAGALMGLVRGWTARDTLAVVVGRLTTWPVLALVAVMTLAGLGSRIVVGYLSPGAYAEEVLAARAFLSERQVYQGDDRAEFGKWLREEPSAADAWTLPGVSSCQASAFEHRPQFFTSQAHSPFLLLASAPAVRLVGGRGLYLLILAFSLAALAAMARILAREAGLADWSRDAWLVALAVAGWQPVLAGIRQGDAVLVASALVVFSWACCRRDRPVAGGLAAGLAASLVLPAVPVLLALVRRPRALATGVGTAACALAVTVMTGGPMLVADFLGNVGTTARIYAGAMPNYALAGRLSGAGQVSLLTIAGVALVCVVLALWRARTIDQAFAVFAVLGLLVAPLAWSQHMTIALVSIAVLFAVVSRAANSAGLAAWALVVLGLSLPDPAVALLSDALSSPLATPWPIVPFVLAGLWAWLALSPGARALASPAPPGPAAASLAP